MRPNVFGALSALALLAAGRLAAQAEDSLPAFNSVRTPVSPAFVLLGIAPTAVERPNTPADFAVSVLDRTAALTRLPQDVALEISPYWLVRHPTLRWQDDTTRGPFASLARTATISVATADLGTEARPVTGLAVAVRASIASGRLSQETTDQLRKLVASLAGESEIIESLIVSARAAAESVLISERAEARARRDAGRARLAAARTPFDSAVAAADTVAARAAADAAIARFDAEKQALLAQAQLSPVYAAAVERTEAVFRDLSFNRQGLVLEVAGGAVWRAPGGAVDSARVSQWGAWVTAGYESPSWSFVAVNRFLAAVTDTASDVLDIGVRLIHTERRWALSAEGVFRAFTEAGGPPNQHRIVGVFDYALRDGLWVNATFGRDYDRSAAGSLLAQLGISIGFAGERVQMP